MTVRVQLFAAARQLAGQDSLDLDLPEPATVAQLREALAARAPALAALLPHAMFAIDAEYAEDQAIVPAGAAVACIPPVSGG